jgi:hypothetical protein
VAINGKTVYDAVWTQVDERTAKAIAWPLLGNANLQVKPDYDKDPWRRIDLGPVFWRVTDAVGAQCAHNISAIMGVVAQQIDDLTCGSVVDKVWHPIMEACDFGFGRMPKPFQDLDDMLSSIAGIIYDALDPEV